MRWASRSHFHTTLGDDLDDHVMAFRLAADRADLVVVTGGLGPTQDDLTREALAEAAGVPLVEDPASLEAIAAMFARRNRPMAERNRSRPCSPRAPSRCPTGSAPRPGIWMQLGRARSPACRASPPR